MIPELGTFAIILALCFALIQGTSPLIAHYWKDNFYLRLSNVAVIGQFIFLAVAMVFLIICFLKNDMTVVFVREHSHELLPIIYKIGAAWGGHEGSLLLWCLILSFWTVVFSLSANVGWAKRSVPTFSDTTIEGGHASLCPPYAFPSPPAKAGDPVGRCWISRFRGGRREVEFSSPRYLILAILGFISVGFITFLIFTSNPFLRNFPDAPITGEDLTPLLQDPGLIFHPPMLYLGYVGFAIAFAFAIGALLQGKFDRESARACRSWVVLPWLFLGCGIILGSWWAYRELGWGGWWFWDPVENASLLPWLSATALLHSLIVTEKRGNFQGWTILLAIITFALSLLGTFLVRSGVLVSVHAFASDPTRGIFLLCYLALIIGGALLLYCWKINKFYRPHEFQLFSRETFMLINTVVLLTAVATIMIGTLYPILLDALNLGKISVGEPYFNTVFLPIILPLLLIMGAVPHVNWQHYSFFSLWKKSYRNLLFSLLIGLMAPWSMGYPFHLLASCGVFLASWIIISTGKYAWRLSNKFALRPWAMIMAHLGIAVLALGITLNKSYSEERQIKIAPGEQTTLAGYQFTFANVTTLDASNYQSLAANFLVKKKNSATHLLTAEERVYRSHQQTLSRPAVTFNVWRDLYLALGNAFDDGSWSVRIYYKPFVRWIWFGGFLTVLGGMLSLFHFLRRSKQSDESLT